MCMDPSFYAPLIFLLPYLTHPHLPLMSVYIRYAGTISFLHSPYCPFLFVSLFNDRSSGM
jgi:hypothetical protein